MALIPKFKIPAALGMHKATNGGADLADGDYVISPEGGNIRYALNDTQPGADDSTIPLDEGDWMPISISAGNQLWVVGDGRLVHLHIGA